MTVNRREFLTALGASTFIAPRLHAAAPFPVKFRRQAGYEPLLSLVEPGLDEFPFEKIAMEVEHSLRSALSAGGFSLDLPAIAEYRDVAPGVKKAVYARDARTPWSQWRESLGTIRYSRFYVLPGDVLRYDIRSENQGRLEHRVGFWKYQRTEGKLAHVEPVEEIVTYSNTPWFRDVTGYSFENDRSFHEQLARGVPYWRSRLDPACGIDVYGENGVAAADIDGDGLDEIYVCQPGGLPNRLYKNDGAGRFHEISKDAGLDILDDTTCALFADFRNSGHQDLILVRSNRPMLFLNDGKGRFTLVQDAFRFATPAQGSFTGVSAADFDRDGRLDIYLCSYVYYQSEAQYRYPVPYHDAQNGPPNFLFRNRLNEKPGYFEDATAAAGLDHNNNRFSFAGAWCDYDGDGWPDLYVTNDFGRNNLYKNSNGHFRDVAAEAGVEDIGPGMSSAWLDYDSDGRPDLFVSNMWSASGQRVVNSANFGPTLKDASVRESYRHHVKGDSLYHNNGDGTFQYTGAAEGTEIVPWSWSCDGCDFDNDGVPEIYVACGMVTNNSPTDLMSYFYRQVVSKSPPKYMAAPEYENGWNAINQLIRQDDSWAAPEPNVLFARRAGRFYDHSGISGLDRAEDSRAFAFTDIDGDGNVDIVLKSRLGPQVRVLQNHCGTSRKTITLALRGTKSNRDAIGAKVDIDGQVKWLVAGSAYLSQHSKRLHFGLGDRGHAEKVRIQWPSGVVQELSNLAAGFLYTVEEGNPEIASQPMRQRKDLPDNVKFDVDNRARLQTSWFWEPVPLPDTRRGPALFIVHAGETVPAYSVAVDTLDLRQADPDLAAAYSIFRRYLFDYRTGLETPLFLLIDAESRVRKVYAEAPDDATAQADLRSLNGTLPEVRGLPFDGVFTGTPRRDYYKFGGALLQAGYPKQALPYFEEMRRRNPDNARALVALGRIYLGENREAEARQSLQRAVEVDPRLPAAWNELGGVEMQAGNAAEALRCYEHALSLAPDLGYVLINAAQAHDKLGHAADSEKLYRRLLSLEPNNGDAANGLGLLLARQGRTVEARKLFELAISVHRDDSSAINNLGVLYVNMGQPNDAIAAFQYGIKVAPDSEELYLNLARVWIRMGNREKAQDVMRGLLARKPGSAIAAKALRELETP